VERRGGDDDFFEWPARTGLSKGMRMDKSGYDGRSYTRELAKTHERAPDSTL
jgi:hypothetical protein